MSTQPIHDFGLVDEQGDAFEFIINVDDGSCRLVAVLQTERGPRRTEVAAVSIKQWNAVAVAAVRELAAEMGETEREKRSPSIRPGLNRISPLVGRELGVLLISLMEDGAAERVDALLHAWRELAREERWWLYSKAAAPGQRVGVGWRKALFHALSETSDKHLKRFNLKGDDVQSRIRVGANSNSDARLRQLLEKLDLSLRVEGKSGLGTKNTLFMACELILLAQESEGCKLLLIEEPEAHLHPQKQLRVMKALQALATEDGIQIIVTTHSPNLASVIELDNLVLLWKSHAFALNKESTKLSASDYSFLQRFLDVTKANLFFARGVLIVEGDAENILLPTIATILESDFTENGVSIVNVGGVGLSRYARIFMRRNSKQTENKLLDIPVACITDMDVMPNCAPAIIGRTVKGNDWPALGNRHWRAKRDFKDEAEIAAKRSEKISKGSDESVRTFVSDEWTLEYDLSLGRKIDGKFSGGLAEDVFIAASLAEHDDAVHAEKITTGAITSEKAITIETIVESARAAFLELRKISASDPACITEEVLASLIYAKFAKDKVSKPIAAQYLAQRLLCKYKKKEITADSLRNMLPAYITEAIDYVAGGNSIPLRRQGEPDGK